MNPAQIFSIVGTAAGLAATAISTFNAFQTLKMNAAIADLRRELAERDLRALKEQLGREEGIRQWAEAHFARKAAP